MSLKVIDNIQRFANASDNAMDVALNDMAINIERLSKEVVPVDKGQLRASGLHRRLGLKKYVVEYNKEYARFQEFGGDGKRVVRNYTYPGKKAHYLGDAGNTISKNAVNYFQKAVEFIKI